MTDDRDPTKPVLELVRLGLEDQQEPVLLAAQLELERRYQTCEQWQERLRLSHLATVADHTRRVALSSTSPGYRAEKAAVLREAALALVRDTLISVAGPSNGDEPTGDEATLTELFALVETVVAAATQYGFGVADPYSEGELPTGLVAGAAGDLAAWVRRQDQQQR